MRILLVEDDEKLNKTLTFKLEKEGFAVDACHDGEEACFYGENNIYDIILLDRMLPNMEGTQVLTHLRKNKIATPVILLTGRASSGAKWKLYPFQAGSSIIGNLFAKKGSDSFKKYSSFKGMGA